MPKHVLSLVLLLCALFAAPASAQVPPEKKVVIEQLIVMTGAEKIGQMFGESVIDNMSKSLRAARPDIPERAHVIVREEVLTVIREGMRGERSLYALLYPIYDKYFTLEDLKGLVQFYSTPLGRKAIAVLPQLTQEAMAVGQSWGEGLGPVIEARVVRRLQAENLLPQR